MKRYFRSLSLTAKLMLIAVIPLALLIFFALQIYKEKNEKLDIFQTYLNRSQQASVISDVVEALQMERRFSFGYAIDKQWQNEMLVERAKTDALLKEIRDRRYQTDENILEYTFLDSLPIVRKKLDQGLMAPLDVLSFFTNCISRLNTLNLISVATVKY